MATKITLLLDSSRKITDLISVVDSVVFQSYMLTSNEDLDACRSVVIAKRIKVLMDDIEEKIERSEQHIAGAGKTMNEVANQVSHVNNLMTEISTYASETTAEIPPAGKFSDRHH